tara:strand:+ start:97 stop:993 length:897 start_codon:yes stop_codon:yes gene_type:complete
LANIGRETVLKRGLSVIAGVKVLSLDWSSETVDISQGEDDGYRLSCEIDGLTTFEIQVEGLTKDHELQDVALSRSGSRLLENITIELASPFGLGKTVITSDFYLANFNVTANYNDAISFNCTLIGSAIIQNGQIININIDGSTGRISGTPGYDFSLTEPPSGITCTSNYYESGYWQGAGLGTGASWSGSVWEKGSFNPAIILDEDGTFGNWVAGYTPTKMYITASDSESRTFTVSLLDQSLVEIITSSPTINLTPTPQSFEFTLDFTGLSDIENLSMATTGPNTGSITISCIQFDPPT